MWDILKRNKLLLALTVIFSVAASIVVVGFSLLIQKTIDAVIVGDMETFYQILMISVIYGLAIGLLYFSYDIFSKMFIRNFIRMLRYKIFSGILKRNYKEFYESNTADYISALTNDMKLIEENYIVPLLEVLQYTLMFVATVAILWYLNPVVMVCLLLSIVVIFICPMIFGKILEQKQLQVSHALAKFTTKVKDLLSGYDVVRSFGLKENAIKKLEKENIALANTKFSADRLFVVNESISQVLGLGTQFIAIFLSGFLVIKGELTMGMLLAIVQLSATLVQPVIMIMNNIPKLGSTKLVIERINGFLNQSETCVDFVAPTFKKEIVVQDLSFQYEENQPLLEHIDLKIEKNKKYAILGESGCGKSTLLKLIFGYYQEFHGEITYDEKNIRSLNTDQMNQMMAMIHQNVYLFDTTVKNNICLGDTFTDEEIQKALRLSGADRFIDTNEKLFEVVGENGGQLSGGQRQRIAIARALIQKTPILVLDEGTSAIDLQNAYEIEKNLLDLNEVTLLTITHKTSAELLAKYDEIIYMENGKIVEKGLFEELLKQKGRFYQFYQMK